MDYLIMWGVAVVEKSMLAKQGTKQGTMVNADAKNSSAKSSAN